MICETHFESSSDETGMDLFDIFLADVVVSVCDAGEVIAAECFVPSAIKAPVSMETASLVYSAGWYLGHIEKTWSYKRAFGTRRRITKSLFVKDSACFAK